MQRAGRSCLLLERTEEFPDRDEGRVDRTVGCRRGAPAWPARRDRQRPWARHSPPCFVRPGARSRSGAGSGVGPGSAARHRRPDDAAPPRRLPGAVRRRRCSGRRDSSRRRSSAGRAGARPVGQVERGRWRTPLPRAALLSAPTAATRSCDGRSDSSWPRTRRTICSPACWSTAPTGSPPTCRQSAREGHFHFLVFPQGGGRARLYLGFGRDQANRFVGRNGPRAFVNAFRFECLPEADALADAIPVSPCGTYPNEDARVGPYRCAMGSC